MLQHWKPRLRSMLWSLLHDPATRNWYPNLKLLPANIWMSLVGFIEIRTDRIWSCEKFGSAVRMRAYRAITQNQLCPFYLHVLDLNSSCPFFSSWKHLAQIRNSIIFANLQRITLSSRWWNWYRATPLPRASELPYPSWGTQLHRFHSRTKPFQVKRKYLIFEIFVERDF